MTKKQVLFWRIILIFIIVLGGYFIAPNISGDKKQNPDQIVEKGIDENEIELSIRPDDFYKKKKDKN
ncbi:MULTISPECIES: hypothetical protein [Psychrilyobacter]|uniref:Uncharacterized protein n=1 Tax=Psychrilyobacter piezotolerans TaxID=2293438 RepID=A0ABX9KHV8_9FUSO|nr:MULTISPECIES: hypothetical protein [Psychrilyobacter]MCS5421187.1 hypothetical protein [Psychrilyobacter sp. S5]NDI77622.1 hypothetical protein [Psychrilyobacter piezotolerans]RDE62631.1 hypothetical protein DV867_06540 [Psychrilyobacter sp. S5]REI41561.1 hypothetical protein DYH56_06540 [Psychrilyobacter piezotolerans]